ERLQDQPERREKEEEQGEQRERGTAAAHIAHICIGCHSLPSRSPSRPGGPCPSLRTLKAISLMGRRRPRSMLLHPVGAELQAVIPRSSAPDGISIHPGRFTALSCLSCLSLQQRAED